jgi:polyisoprenoid-binding protein YceI
MLAALMLVLASANGAAAAVAPDPDMPSALQLDSRNTEVEFEIAALWILRRHGRFTEVAGRIDSDPTAGTAVISVRIRVDSVRMKDPDHVRLLLSPEFFDAAQHPWIEFRSEPFAIEGKAQASLPGSLSLRGVTRKVRFDIDRGHCDLRVGAGCEVVVNGSLKRSRFGMTEYRRTLADKVHLKIAARIEPANE